MLPNERLTDRDVQQALARVSSRDAERGRDAQHIYETLTWGEGPGVLSQSGLQHWLWYVLPTRYMTDEDGFMPRLAGVAAELFDELGVASYADVSRSEATVKVHSAFERSEAEGYAAMRKAAERSGIDPPGVDGFAWGTVMGTEEAGARSAAESALEVAIATGALTVGRRGWRDAQASIVEATLNGEHPSVPGQSWRSAIVTERATRWADEAASRVPSVRPMIDRLLRRILVPPDRPSDQSIAAALRPWTWLLNRLGDGQAMTAAGYLNRPFVLDVWQHRPWTDELLPLDKPPRSESDDFILQALRELSQAVGAARVTKKVLRRTRLGDAVLSDPGVAWSTLVAGLATKAWPRFVTEWYLAHLLDAAGPVPSQPLRTSVAVIAAESGWRTDGAMPSDYNVSFAFAEPRRLLELFGLLEESGDWSARAYRLTELGTVFAGAYLHAAVTAPRSRP